MGWRFAGRLWRDLGPWILPLLVFLLLVVELRWMEPKAMFGEEASTSVNKGSFRNPFFLAGMYCCATLLAGCGGEEERECGKALADVQLPPAGRGSEGERWSKATPSSLLVKKAVVHGAVQILPLLALAIEDVEGTRWGMLLGVRFDKLQSRSYPGDDEDAEAIYGRRSRLPLRYSHFLADVFRCKYL